ncbi:sigma-70 family RNA polymerase sigma factor [Thalassobaculum sp. OXR-137]|uniref:sigma-70 family RNA polymerase sigma factor n=1 Tax=Thalassobaculum sp. OXR-137 TaxID=3100173 RepID=UPI002AC8D809|nr:sigma-70 family RNA polymerase sigma factor [Thalassobaculum sp. OXR-137]WPZ33470.1 sigma-70 family RNA polymerase sigma factor [Thalassobaculum sp. OXR-137]
MRPEPDIADFETQRPALLRLAYRMLGSMAEAEDVVQESWLRWRQADRGTIGNPPGWLRRVVSRLCLDQLKSARMRRETYVGTWLPEPVVDAPDPELLADNLTYSLMLALERLSPLERAAFLLHDVFEMPLADVAETLDREPASVRQLAVRARRHVRADRPRFPVAPEEGRRVAAAFFEAARLGDAAALKGLLAEDVSLRADGGGKVLAFPNVIQGADKAVRLFCGLARKYAGRLRLEALVTVDGLPAIVSRNGGTLQAMVLEVVEGRIAAIYVIRNPDKLERLSGVLG